MLFESLQGQLPRAPSPEDTALCSDVFPTKLSENRTGIASERGKQAPPSPASAKSVVLALASLPQKLRRDSRVIFDWSDDDADMEIERGRTKIRRIETDATRGLLILHVEESFVRKCAGLSTDEELPCNTGLSTRSNDRAFMQLTGVLLTCDGMASPCQKAFAQKLGQALVIRLLSPTREASASSRSLRPKAVAALAQWRLQRVIEHVEARLDARLTLEEVAGVAGLSRMHFAAQFRAATGYRPHDYLLLRRIERAKILLATSRLVLAEVALSVGFQSQAHFTTVFKRITGLTPRRWREDHGPSTTVAKRLTVDYASATQRQAGS